MKKANEVPVYNTIVTTLFCDLFYFCLSKEVLASLHEVLPFTLCDNQSISNRIQAVEKRKTIRVYVSPKSLRLKILLTFFDILTYQLIHQWRKLSPAGISKAIKNPRKDSRFPVNPFEIWYIIIQYNGYFQR